MANMTYSWGPLKTSTVWIKVNLLGEKCSICIASNYSYKWSGILKYCVPSNCKSNYVRSACWKLKQLWEEGMTAQITTFWGLDFSFSNCSRDLQCPQALYVVLLPLSTHSSLGSISSTSCAMEGREHKMQLHEICGKTGFCKEQGSHRRFEESSGCPKSYMNTPFPPLSLHPNARVLDAAIHLVCSFSSSQHSGNMHLCFGYISWEGQQINRQG